MIPTENADSDDAHMTRVDSRAAGDDGPTTISRKSVVRLVLRWVREQKAGSVVRFGEGEARLLWAQRGDPDSIDIACRKLWRQAGYKFSEASMFHVRDLLLYALDNADIVGIRGSNSFRDEHKMWVDRMHDVYLDRFCTKATAALMTHCLINGDLYEALPEILRGKSAVTVVSCRNVSSVMEQRFGLSDLRIFQIPSQFVKRALDSPYEAALHNKRIWPDCIRDIETRLTVRSAGEIFLIGAGLFGKHLCVRVAKEGGIGLDMGSILDKMVGLQTRKGPIPPRTA